MKRLLGYAWDRIAIYLPIILMGLLALGTYWLVRSTPILEPESKDEPLRKDPDYRIERFSIRTFDGKGALKSEVSGEQARHYPHTDILEIDQAQIRSFNSRGHLIIASARRALVNNDATEVQLLGDAQIVREASVDPQGNQQPRLSYHGEFLHAFLAQERIKSHKPVTLMRGEDRFTADSMELSHMDQLIELKGRVRGTLQSPAIKP